VCVRVRVYVCVCMCACVCVCIICMYLHIYCSKLVRPLFLPCKHIAKKEKYFFLPQERGIASHTYVCIYITPLSGKRHRVVCVCVCKKCVCVYDIYVYTTQVVQRNTAA
jgi:hypothetical protein